MKRVYLILAVVGAVLPYAFFIQFKGGSGGMGEFLEAPFTNAVTSGFTADLLIGSLVFWLWMIQRSQTGGPSPILFVLLNLTIGLSCALPAYLYVSEARRNGAPTTSERAGAA